MVEGKMENKQVKIEKILRLDEYIGGNNLLEVYSKYRDSDSFLLGYLIDELDEYYIFETVDDYGALDGFSLYAKSDVDEILSHTSYTSIYESYVHLQKEKGTYDIFSLGQQYKSVPKKSILSILEYLYLHKKIIMLNETDHEISKGGRVLSIDNSTITLDQVSYYNDWENSEIEIKQNVPIEISKIIGLDIISKDNYLYEQYLKQK